jgi:hypothetical protein
MVERSGECTSMRTGEHLDDGSKLPLPDQIDWAVALE